VIIADIADQMGIVPYQMATQGDLDETVSQVEALDRRILAIKADVRDQQQLDDVAARGIRLSLACGHSGGWLGDGLAVEVDGLDLAEGADVGAGIALDDDQVGVVAGAEPSLAVAQAAGAGRDPGG